ncbi:MAG: YggU family protein [Methanomicrobiales archaeon]|nr:YggU family protein [Methanomicrobiales archaeon]
MTDFSPAIAEDSHGTVLAIEVTAGAKTASFPAGYNEWRKMIGCRVTAPALEGRANKAVMALVAQRLDVPASSVSILSGATSSQKRVLVTGLCRNEVVARLLEAGTS